jgi:hypothetical protein
MRHFSADTADSTEERKKEERHLPSPSFFLSSVKKTQPPKNDA